LARALNGAKFPATITLNDFSFFYYFFFDAIDLPAPYLPTEQAVWGKKIYKHQNNF